MLKSWHAFRMSEKPDECDASGWYRLFCQSERMIPAHQNMVFWKIYLRNVNLPE